MYILYVIDLIVMLILFFGFSMLASYHMIIKIVYLPLVIYFLFGAKIGSFEIDIVIHLLFYMLALYVVYKKYLMVFCKVKSSTSQSSL